MYTVSGLTVSSIVNRRLWPRPIRVWSRSHIFFRKGIWYFAVAFGTLKRNRSLPLPLLVKEEVRSEQLPAFLPVDERQVDDTVNYPAAKTVQFGTRTST